MINLFEIGINILEDLIIMSFLTRYFGCKYTGIKAVFGFIVSLAAMDLLLTYINSLYIYEAFLGVIFAVVYYLYCLIFLKGDAYTKLFIAGFINCIVYSIAMFSQLYICILLDDNTYQIYDMSLERILQISISKLLLIIVCAILLQFRFEYVANKSNIMLFILMPIVTEMSTIGIMQVFLKHNELKNELFLAAIGIMLTNALIYYIFVKTNKNIKTEAQVILLRQKVENDKKNAEDVEELYNKSCAVRHDLFIHFDTILALLNESPDSVRNYIQDVTHKHLDVIRKMVNTGNSCFDAIVNAKIALCDQYNIASEVHVTKNSLNSLPHDEIAILFGNLFDNAIEASRDSERKIIRLDVQVQNEDLSICMRNSVDHSVLERNKNLKTTKVNKELHGFGLKNITNIVKAHNGLISYDEEYGCFICDILLPFNKSNA